MGSGAFTASSPQCGGFAGDFHAALGTQILSTSFSGYTGALAAFFRGESCGGGSRNPAPPLFC
jgi:hypothetical protein